MYLIYGLIAWFVIFSRPFSESIQAPVMDLPWWLIVLGCVYLAYILVIEGYSVFRIHTNPEYRDKVREVYADKAWLFPQGHRQVAMFYAIAVIVGIVEELFYRGFLTRYLMDPPFGLSWAWAAVILGVVFGVGHFPQGWQAVISISLHGMLFWFLYAWTGNIWPAIVLHILYDARIGYVSRVVNKVRGK